MQLKSLKRIGQDIQIDWSDDHQSIYPPLLLRSKCPCAVCREIPERDQNGTLPTNQISATINIKAAHPVGWYALQFVFSDGHDTGLYSFEMLRKICPCPKCHGPVDEGKKPLL